RAVEAHTHVEYVAIDIAATALRSTAESLVREFEGLTVTGIAATFESGLLRIENLIQRDPEEVLLVLFLGSTIGNLDPGPRDERLRSIRSLLRAGDALLRGADLAKSESVLIPAYDDALGVTAAFNRN